MYISKSNIQKSAKAIQAYVEENAFATIISKDQSQIFATHTPLMLKIENNKEYLYGHIARANEQVATLRNGEKVLAIFMEKHTYISSSWYDHVNVPTWNYIAVHIQGEIELLDADQTLQSLHHLVNKYENNNENRFHIDQMTDRDLKAHLNGLVAFKIKIEKIDASWKLSQNRDDKNYENIILKLRNRGDQMSSAIADEMENIRHQ